MKCFKKFKSSQQKADTTERLKFEEGECWGEKGTGFDKLGGR